MKNRDVRFHELNEKNVNISTESRLYRLRKDDMSGDWVVMCHEDTQVQEDWMLTKDDAIKYTLEKLGIIEDANYQRAPDRTSA